MTAHDDDSTPTVREAGDEGIAADVERAWVEFNRNTPEAFWDVAVWVNGNWLTGSLDVANRKAIGLRVLRAALAPETPEAGQ